MHFLRDRWRRTAFHQFFGGLEPIDRVVFTLFVVLAFVVAFSVSAIMHGSTGP